jgi:hypothetical protein
VTPGEFEELMTGDPIDLEYQTRSGEERFKVLAQQELAGCSSESGHRETETFEPSLRMQPAGFIGMYIDGSTND